MNNDDEFFFQELTYEKLAAIPTNFENRLPDSVKPVAQTEISQHSSYSMSNPRILKGDERTKFVTTVRDSTFFPEKTDEQTIKIS